MNDRPGPGEDPDVARRGWVAAAVSLVLPVLLFAAAIVVVVSEWSRLPVRIADHWTASGAANGTGSRVATFAALLVLGAAGVGVSWAGWFVGRRQAGPGTAGRPGRGTVSRPPGTGATLPAGAGLGALGVFLTAVSTGLVVMVVTANLGGGGLSGASVSAAVLPAQLGGAAVLAALTSYAQRRYGGGGAPPGPRPSLGLGPGERAVWTGRARANWALPAAVLMLAVGAVVGAVAGQWVPGAILLAAGLVTLCFTSVKVTAGARGLAVGYGPLGLRLTRIPLGRIASAEAVERTAFSFGYRGSLAVFGTAAVALRRGPALRLALRDGKSFLVTVDDAATGAALLNDLITAG